VRLLPKDPEFFKMFAELADRITESARLLHALFQDPGRLHEQVGAIKQLEHQADVVTHQVIERINKSFITPIDREDIHMLASRLDNVIDYIDDTARRAQYFRIKEVHAPAIELTALLVQVCEAIRGAVTSVKDPKVVAETSRVVKRLEEEADTMYHESMGQLFDGTPDALQVIKWKDLYDTIEAAIDACEDVANTLEGISLKNS
jgi:predicted phosphate transport protein (TIGR00153 family)